MAKRDSGKQTNAKTTSAKPSGVTPAAAMEQRVLAFAEQLGRLAGTVQSKAEGWMDRETLNKHLAGVRDGAADLLQQLADGVTAASADQPPAPAAPAAKTGRSGGVVDAPGKKHRKPLPSDPGANIAKSQAAKLQTKRTMVKTNKRRGRG